MASQCQANRELGWAVGSLLRAVLGMWSLTDSTGVGTVRQCSAGHRACGGRPRSWFPSSWYLTSSLCWCLETPWHSLFPLNSAGLCGAELHWPCNFPGSFASRETVTSGSACSPLWTRPLSNREVQAHPNATSAPGMEASLRGRILWKSSGRQQLPAACGAPVSRLC